MLIYNHKKEFIGIDAVDLKRLGFINFEDLTLEIDDFADLFVKTPGFIHNFKHVNWIDFVICADSPESTKVIIHANSKKLQCNLNVESFHLTQEPSSEAFLISLNNLRELGDDQIDYTSMDSLKNSISESITQKSIEVTEPSINLIEDTFEDSFEDPIEESIDLKFNDYEENFQDDLKIELEESIDLKSNDDEKKNSQDNLKINLVENIIDDNGYRFDPLIASDKLGLPVELIEEFIEDFIVQANDFKNELFTLQRNGDKNQLRVLSHKLKGVAANLRIEDALRSLVIINTSDNDVEIKKELDIFYQIITKLSSPIQSIKTNALIEPQTIDLKLKNDETLDKIDIVEEEELGIELQEDFQITLVDDQVELKEEEEEKALEQYDKNHIANEIGLDQDSFNELFKDYIEESEELTTSISTAIETKNIDNWKHQALKLKGMSDHMRISSFIRELEILIQTQDATEAKHANENIIEKLRQLSIIRE